MDRKAIESSLDRIRPSLQAEGGDVELVEIGEDGVIKVRLTGMCGSCPMSQITLKQGIETYLKEVHPEVKTVEAV